MQFLPSLMNNISAQSTKAGGKTTAKQAYGGLFDLQTGKSTQSFKSIMDSAEIRANQLEKAKNAREAIANNGAFWQQDRNALARANEFAQKANDNSKLNLKDSSSKSQKSVAEVFSKELNSGIEKDKNTKGEENSAIANFISPYSMPTQTNIHTELPRLKTNEVNILIDGMKEAGYDNKKVLNALEKAGNSPLGVTGEELARVGIEALAGDIKKPTAAQERQLLSIAQKINDASTTDEDLLAKMKNTNPVQLLNGIAKAIDNKGEITFTKHEVNALAQALQLSPSEEKKITNLVKDTNSFSLDKETFNVVFAPAKDEITEKTSAMLELGELLINELPKAEKAAEARVNFENSLEAKSEKYVDNSKTLLEAELLKNGLNTLKESLQSSQNTQGNFAPTAQSKEEAANINNANPNSHLNQMQMKQNVETKLISNAKDVVDVKFTDDAKDTKEVETKHANAENTSKPKNSNAQFAMLTKANNEDIRKSNQWTMSDSLRNAVDVAKREDSFQASANQEKRENTLLNQAQASTQAFNQEVSSVEASNEFYMEEVEMEEKLFQQVEESFTEAVKNKVSKLEVKLNPIELGVMNVVITSKNGELTALIQPEKLETMDMLNKQIDALKTELESQGIKFESIEVELKSSDEENTQFAQNNMEQNFQNPDGSQSQYNQEQMESQLNDLARLRLLGRAVASGEVDINSISPEERELVQNLHEENVVENGYNLGESVFDIVA